MLRTRSEQNQIESNQIKSEQVESSRIKWELCDSWRSVWRCVVVCGRMVRWLIRWEIEEEKEKRDDENWIESRRIKSCVWIWTRIQSLALVGKRMEKVCDLLRRFLHKLRISCAQSNTNLHTQVAHKSHLQALNCATFPQQNQTRQKNERKKEISNVQISRYSCGICNISVANFGNLSNISYLWRLKTCSQPKQEDMTSSWAAYFSPAWNIFWSIFQLAKSDSR